MDERIRRTEILPSGLIPAFTRYQTRDDMREVMESTDRHSDATVLECFGRENRDMAYGAMATVTVYPGPDHDQAVERFVEAWMLGPIGSTESVSNGPLPPGHPDYVPPASPMAGLTDTNR